MIKTCKECGKDFLTESDPFVMIPHKWTVNCGCFFTKELEEKCARYENELADAILKIQSTSDYGQKRIKELEERLKEAKTLALSYKFILYSFKVMPDSVKSPLKIKDGDLDFIIEKINTFLSKLNVEQ